MPAQPNTEPGLLPLLLREQNAVPCVSGRGEIAPPVVFAISSQILFHIPWEGLSWPPATGSGLSAAEVAWGLREASQSVGTGDCQGSDQLGWEMEGSPEMSKRERNALVHSSPKLPPHSFLSVLFPLPHCQNSADIFQPFAFAQSRLSR